jgi:hypothetical protein
MDGDRATARSARRAPRTTVAVAGCLGVAAVLVGWLLSGDDEVAGTVEVPRDLAEQAQATPVGGAAEHPPLVLDEVDAGDGCPVSPQAERSGVEPFERVLVGDHVELAGLGAPPWRDAPTMVVDPQGREAPLLLRGQRLDGPGELRFVWQVGHEPAPELRRDVYRVEGGTAAFFTVVVPSPGCWAYQVDGEDFTEVLVFELDREAFELLPAHRRHGPDQRHPYPDGSGWP